MIDSNVKEQVLAAYAETGLVPIDGRYVRTDGDGNITAGCALTALYVQANGLGPIKAMLADETWNTDGEVVADIRGWANYKYSRAFNDGLTTGFDGSDYVETICLGLNSCVWFVRSEFDAGLAVGKELRELVFAEPKKENCDVADPGGHVGSADCGGLSGLDSAPVVEAETEESRELVAGCC